MALDFEPPCVGAADTLGSLRAQLAPGGGGRRYTLVYEGVDRAGTTSRCAVELTVRTGR